MTIITTLIQQLENNNQAADVQEALDDMVHDIFEQRAFRNNPHCQDSDPDAFEDYLDRESQAASDLNNTGQEAQRQFIHAHQADSHLAAVLKEILENGEA